MEKKFKKRLSKYHQKRWKHIRAALKKFSKKEEDEVLHSLRLETKKLTALYHFIEACNNDFESDAELKPVLKIFKLSGKIRDYRNAKEFCKKYDMSHDYFVDHAKKQQRYLKKLRRKRKGYRNRFEVLEAKASYYLKDLQADQLSLYIISCKEDIAGELSNKPSGKALHEARKKIKELCFMAELSIDQGPGILNASALNKLDSLQDDIGKWHDLSKFRERVQKNMTTPHRLQLTALAGEEKRLIRAIRKTSAEIVNSKGK